MRHKFINLSKRRVLQLHLCKLKHEYESLPKEHRSRAKPIFYYLITKIKLLYYKYGKLLQLRYHAVSRQTQSKLKPDFYSLWFPKSWFCLVVRETCAERKFIPSTISYQ